MAFTVRNVPDGFWFKLQRNGEKYFKIGKGRTGNHSLCVKKGQSDLWNMSNQSHAVLISDQGKPKIRIKS